MSLKYIEEGPLGDIFPVIDLFDQKGKPVSLLSEAYSCVIHYIPAGVLHACVVRDHRIHPVH